MDIQLILELHKQLDKLIADLPTSQFDNFTAAFENIIFDIIDTEILKEYKSDRNDRFIDIEGVTYSLDIAENLSQPNNVIIVLRNIIDVNEKIITTNISLDTNLIGQFKFITLILPAHQQYKKDRITNKVNDVYKITYSWLSEFIKKKLASLESELSNNLYAIIQRTFHSLNKSNLIEHLWLVIIDSKTKLGYYIVGGEKTTKAIGLLNSNNDSVFSTADLIVNFCTSGIDFDKMFSKVAIREKKAMDFKLNVAKYKKENNKFLASESIMFNSKMFRLFPIVTEGKFFFIAAYKIDYKNELDPVLLECKESLSNVIASDLKSIISIINLLKDKYSELSLSTELGKFIGGFVSGYTS
jgi:hypothetical protein